MSTTLLTPPVFEKVTREDKICPGPQIYGKGCCSKWCLTWTCLILYSMMNLCVVSDISWAPGMRQWLKRPSLFGYARDQNKTGIMTVTKRILVVVTEFLTRQIAALHHFCTLAFNSISGCFSLTSETHQSQTSRMFFWCIDEEDTSHTNTQQHYLLLSRCLCLNPLRSSSHHSLWTEQPPPWAGGHTVAASSCQPCSVFQLAYGCLCPSTGTLVWAVRRVTSPQW